MKCCDRSPDRSSQKHQSIHIMDANVQIPFVDLRLREKLKAAFNDQQHSICIEILKKLHDMRNDDDPYCACVDLLKEALNWASQHGAVDVFLKLLEYGFDADHVDSFGNTPIILASERGHVEMVKLLLEKPCDINRADLETRTALHWSSMNGHTEIVNLLLSHGASADKRDQIYGYTPLMLASRQGHAPIVALLLSRGCEPDSVDIHQESAVFDAVRNAQVECVKLLLKAGASFDVVDRYGRTVLLSAVLWNRISMVALLVKLNARLDIPGQTQYVQSLSVSPQNGNFQQSRVLTPIEAALMEGKKEVSYILYMAGASRQSLYRYVTDEVFREYIKTMTGNYDIDKMMEWLKDVLKVPRSLKECSRIVIRQCCRDSRDFMKLTLPKVLCDYVNLPEIDEFL